MLYIHLSLSLPRHRTNTTYAGYVMLGTHMPPQGSAPFVTVFCATRPSPGASIRILSCCGIVAALCLLVRWVLHQSVLSVGVRLYRSTSTGAAPSFTVGPRQGRPKSSVGRSAVFRPTDRAPTELRATRSTPKSRENQVSGQIFLSPPGRRLKSISRHSCAMCTRSIDDPGSSPFRERRVPEHRR